MKRKNKQERSEIESLPHQISSPDFRKSHKKLQPPFVNEFGVTIGDSNYVSEQSPLENWSDDVDPAVMAGDKWVHPTNDIGFNTPENRALIEEKELPDAPFSHPTKDAGYKAD
ncbi:DUF3905 domain-containing protein [Cytobacillus sp. FSL W7-1323]|uniref:DUF3905 domain-containing protein n=1 Tax=Cytobacillus kochii TaxID=859143 RepID=A0A248TDC7_9BACI|nr:DUF3905 domain-containing protein [Cytobacillus kochii]ASV66156.1 hypothetical protein CKF48_01710 [Cytobacillus kochii]MDQ0185051.1 hypothetical protein [Cytobacillus kochii]